MCYMKGSFFKNAGVLRVRYGHKVTFVLKRKKKMKCTRPKNLLKVPTTYFACCIPFTSHLLLDAVGFLKLLFANYSIVEDSCAD